MAETKTAEGTKAKAKSKTELLAEKMKQKQVGKTAFEAGAKPIVETKLPEIEPEPAQETPNAAEVSKDTPEVKEPSSVAQEAQKSVQTATKEKKATEDAAKQKKAATAKKPAKEDRSDDAPVKLLEKIAKNKSKRVEKRSNAYYFSVKNIEELAKRADEAGMSASELLDSILTEVFSE